MRLEKSVLKKKVENLDNIRREAVRKKISIITIICIVLYFIYIQEYSQIQIEWESIFLFVFSAIAVQIGFDDIVKNGVKISNVFLVCYFVFLSINCLKISRLQKTKDILDIYYLLSGPLLFFGIVKFFDDLKIKNYLTGKRMISANTLANILIFLTIFLKLLIYNRTGIRLLDSNWGGGVGDEYSVRGLTGLSTISIWLLLLLIPRVNKIHKIVIVILSLLFEAVFSISRNNAMMILIYLILIFSLSRKSRLLIDKKVVRRIIIVLTIILLLFMAFGNYRQIMRGWNDPNSTINYFLQSTSNNGVLNWLYGYTAINYDVIIQIMANANHRMTIYSVTSPIIRLFAGNSALAGYHNEVYHIRALNGFNASTMFGPMVYEMGGLYIIQVIFLSIQVGILGYIARKERSSGHYAYLMTFAALGVFGNFYSITIYFYISIMTLIIYLVIPANMKGDEI